MTDYRLPPGMTAKNLRFIADDLRSHNFVVFANTLGSWADAIDPPAPKSIATDEAEYLRSLTGEGDSDD